MHSRLPRLVALLGIAVCVSTVRAQAPSAQADSPARVAVEEAIASFNDKKYDEALARLREAEKLDPESPFIHNLIGAAYAKKKDYAAAKTAFEKALEESPGYFPANFNVGELLSMQKMYPQALEYFARMLRSYPENELLQFKVVLSLLLTDQINEARDLANRMKFPGEEPAWYFAQAAIHLKENQKRKALGFISSAKSIFPGKTDLYVEAFDELGWPVK